MTLLADARVVTPDGVLDPGWVQLSGSRIAAVGAGAAPAPPDVRFPGRWLAPGFVDVHVHGGGGYASAAADDVRRAVALHRPHGTTTTTLASLVTASLDRVERAVRQLADCVVDGLIAGIHLEGPFMSPLRRGAHDRRFLLPRDRDHLDRLLRAGQGTVRR
jgi:N-acetylglucosamine-6-phosphate deacetylase